MNKSIEPTTIQIDQESLLTLFHSVDVTSPTSLILVYLYRESSSVALSVTDGNGKVYKLSLKGGDGLQIANGSVAKVAGKCSEPAGGQLLFLSSTDQTLPIEFEEMGSSTAVIHNPAAPPNLSVSPPPLDEAEEVERLKRRSQRLRRPLSMLPCPFVSMKSLPMLIFGQLSFLARNNWSSPTDASIIIAYPQIFNSISLRAYTSVLVAI